MTNQNAERAARTPRFCSACGAGLLPNAVFCGSCGELLPFSTSTTNNDGKSSTKNPSRILIATAALVATVLLTVAGGFLAGRLIHGEPKSAAAETGRLKELAAKSTTTTQETTTTRRQSSTSSSLRATSTTSPSNSTTTSLGSGAGSWVSVLASIPIGATEAQKNSALATASREGTRTVSSLVSSDYSSLRPGYFVLYSSGFANEAEANSYCTSIGKAIPAQCYARLVKR